MQKKNKLFIWIPKTAGTSLFNLLKEQIGMIELLDNGYKHFKNEGSVTFGHTNVGDLIRNKIITKKYWSECYPFIVVRNPYSRFISLYNDFIRSKRIKPEITPYQFAYSIKLNPQRPGLYNVLGLSQCSPQVHWMLPGINVFRFERLQDYIEHHLMLNARLPHLNKETFKPWQEYYDTTLYKIVTEIYYADLLLLDYPFINSKEEENRTPELF